VLAGFAEGDAISSEALALRDLLRGLGAASEIFVDPGRVSRDMRCACRPLAELQTASGDVVIGHYAVASPAVEAFARCAGRKVLLYHNITPAAYFRGYDDVLAAKLEAARADLRALIDRVDDLWADSAFNAAELERLGAGRVSVFPLVFDPRTFDSAPDPRILSRFAVRIPTLLFVGRMVPNKRVEDLVEAFAWYHRTVNRRSRLLLVGSAHSCPRYGLMLKMLARDLDLPNVCFEGYASPAGLSAYYDVADLFVTASEHEGYCLPLVEAMHKGVPVLARRCGGMPEAMGAGGVRYADASPAELAALIDRLLRDDPLRREVLASQAGRLREVRARRADRELAALLGIGG
jgi:glycosyltransferase involved in cell wall biosynthesis